MNYTARPHGREFIVGYETPGTDDSFTVVAVFSDGSQAADEADRLNKIQLTPVS